MPQGPFLTGGGGSGGGGGGTVTGTGTLNHIARWTSATAIGDTVFTTDGTNLIIPGAGGVAFGGATASDGKIMKSGAFGGVGVDVLAGDSSAYGQIRTIGYMIGAVSPPVMSLSASARGMKFTETGTFTDIQAGNPIFYDDTLVTGSTVLTIRDGVAQGNDPVLRFYNNGGVVLNGEVQVSGGFYDFWDASGVAGGIHGIVGARTFTMNGSTSGALDISTTPITASYAIVFPAAQGSGALTNDGAGNLTWTAAGGVTYPLLSNDVYSVSTPSYSRSGDANTGLGFPAADTLALITAGVEKWRVTSAGALIPATDNAYHLGNSTNALLNVYARTLVGYNGGAYAVLTIDGAAVNVATYGTTAFSFNDIGGGFANFRPGTDVKSDIGEAARRVRDIYAQSHLAQTANGANLGIRTISESITLATGGLTTDSTANLLPANAIILWVSARITTTITTTTDWALGDATTAARFASANATLTAGTTSVSANQMKGSVSTDAAGPLQTAAAKLRITCTGANPGAGAIRVTVGYIDATAPTS